MPISNYPSGFAQGVAIRGIPLLNLHGGNVFWVDSGAGADTGKGTHNQPFGTIDYAIGRCTASNGDIIIVKAGHTEKISAAGDIALDVAGIHIIGLGQGQLRPIITYDTADTAILNVTGANCTIENIILTANFADIVMAIDVDAKDFMLKNCSFQETATDMNFFSCVGTDDTANAADGLSVIDCERISVDAEALAFISILGNCDRLCIIGNFDNQASAADIGHFLIMADKVCLGARIIGNILNLTGDNNAQTVGIFATGSSATSTGVMAYNLCGSLDTTTEIIITATLDFQQFENYYTGVIAKSGKLWPVVDGA